MINIDLKLFATLLKYKTGSSGAVRVADGSSVEDLIRQLNIPEDEVKLVFVNNIRRQKDFILNDNDRVGLFPPVGGG